MLFAARAAFTARADEAHLRQIAPSTARREE